MPPAPPRNRSGAASAASSSSSVKAPLNSDAFLNELTAMFERSTEKGSVWVTLKRSSMKSKVQKNKMATAGEAIEYRCLIRATDGKKTISTTLHELVYPTTPMTTGTRGRRAAAHIQMITLL